MSKKNLDFHFNQGYSDFMRKVAYTLALLFVLFGLVGANRQAAYAANWQATLYDVALPSRIVAVDKSAQKLHLFERHSPLRLAQSYACTTGQQAGDKYATGDLRTPEGVYFVGYKIANGLDFQEYGGVAYTLNYPNPVDRARGKTGHGIWIHSKGHEISPMETRGCVAVNLPDIAELGPLLPSGTAVIMAERITGTLPSAQSPITAQLLRNKMQLWTRAWATRSHKMFAFYDHENYTRAQPESFQAFRANKERLFNILPWIEIINREIHVLEGPDYWVTWSEQFYRAPNLSTEGIRRLYWQRNAKGEFLIVGMEWEPRDLGMRTAYLKGALAAAPELSISDAALLPGGEESLPVSVSEATQTSPIRPEEITVPERPLAPPPAASPAPEEPARGERLVLAQADIPASASPPETSPAASPTSPPDNEVVLLLQNQTNTWLQALASRSDDIFKLYNTQLYGKLGTRQSFRSARAEMERTFRTSPWLHVQHRAITIAKQDKHWTSSCPLLLVGPTQTREGVQRLYWQQGQDGQFRIVGSEWLLEELAMQVDYLENITPGVSSMLEAWRKVWEDGDLDAYKDFYTSGARQGQRRGQGIFQHKSLVWAKARPELVELSGTRIQMDKDGLRVDMAQVYRDSLGYQDKGIKTLILQPQGDSWLISAEDWAPAPPQL